MPLAVQSHADLRSPVGIVQCGTPDGDVAVIVSCQGVRNQVTRLTKIGFRSGVLESVDMVDSGAARYYDIATLPGSGLVALDFGTSCFKVFTSLALRMGWIRQTVSWQ